MLYRTKQLRLAIHNGHCLPNYIVSINSKYLHSIAATYEGIKGFCDFKPRNFRYYDIVLDTYFVVVGIIQTWTQLFKNSFSLTGRMYGFVIMCISLRENKESDGVK